MKNQAGARSGSGIAGSFGHMGAAFSLAKQDGEQALHSSIFLCTQKPPRLPVTETGAVRLLYLCSFKRSRNHLRGFLIAAWAGNKFAEFSFPEISFHFPLRPWFFFVSPAYAGKRRTLTAALRSRRDHPRVCGEKCMSAIALWYAVGSPPRMRGKVFRCCVSGRITGDHPRVCGEKYRMKPNRICGAGSPPRMRGKASFSRHSRPGDGITPAYAGKR